MKRRPTPSSTSFVASNGQRMAFLFSILWLLFSEGGIGNGSLLVSADQDLIRDDTSLLTESEILLRVYDETRGMRWGQQTNWLQNTDVCTWHGVSCYDSTVSDQRRVGHIQKLDLSGNRLQGTLPEVVYELPYIEVIDCRDNVDLSVSFGNIGEAQYLKELALSKTNVKSLDGIESARQLETLHITSLGMTGPIPSQLFQLTNLVGLYANYNKFSGPISAQIGSLRYLEELYLFNNDLTGQIPSEVGSLTKLRIVTLAENAFAGTLPTELNLLTALNTLAINRADDLKKGAGINGRIPSFSQLQNLVDLRLSNQLFTGSLPSDFLNSASKQETINVELNGNQLTGAVPTSLRDIQRLNLNLANNRISDVPSDLCNEIDGWMGGTVGDLGCNAFLCPPGTSASEGRATPSESCKACDGISYFGATRCASSPSTTNAGYTEREVLISVYNAMGGRYWKNDNSWLSPAVDFCEWYGVECVQGKVTGLLLKNNDLSNSPPVELFSLPELKHLDFESNAIDFKFKGIDNAQKLETLLLSSCDLSSLDDIAELGSTSIRRLKLASNNLEGDLSKVFGIGSLEELDISHNKFSSLPTTIGSLSNLEYFNFAHNKITGQLPSTLGSLVRLRELWGGENEFEGSLPTELSSLTRLETLSIHQTTSANGIGGPLPSFRNLAQLTSLQLDANMLSGSLPSDLLRNTEKGDNEIELRLSDNNLEGEIPEEWATRFSLLMLDVSGNRITGIGNSICDQGEWNRGDVNEFACNAVACPPGKFNEFGRQTGQDTICRDCSHSGSAQYYGSKTCADEANAIIQDSSEVAALKQFYDATNGPNWKNSAGWFSSNDPCNGWYGIQCNIEGKVVTLELDSNGLVGAATPAVFQLNSLRTLSLKDNRVSFIFDGISQLSNLAVLKLSSINLGSVAGISQASGLTELHLTDNRLQGPLPEEIFQLTGLKKLYLNYNALSGRIDPNISEFKALEELFMFNNRFNGQLPGSLGLLSRLRILSLAENSFSGTLPPELNDLTDLEVLSIRREGGTDDDYVGIDQGRNDDLGRGIGGPLLAFDKLTSLRKLYLGVNSLTGSIPHNFLNSIANKALEIEIDLTANRLTGVVPASLAQFDDLSIYLGGNKITGISDGLCRKDNWMKEAVSQFKCNAILCPPGTYGVYGRQQDGNTECLACDSGSSSEFYGSYNCLGEDEKQTLSERIILEDFFEATAGDSWKHSLNWLDSDESICSWYGISCVDGKESVESISILHNGLRGMVPEEVYELPNLKQINLAQNAIDMSFSGINRASKLEYLGLDETNVQSLPGLDSATSLKVLHMAKLNIREFPNEVLSLSSLESLDLSKNPVGSMPSLESLQKLKYFACSECALGGNLPNWPGSITSLEHLALDGNSFRSTIPSVFSALTSLKYLSLDNQGLQGSVPDFAGFTQLQELYLQRNSFDGSLPSSLLQDVNAGTGGKITLDFRYNNITGSVPEGLARIPDLNLYLASNKIDSLPNTVCSVSWNEKDGSMSGCDHILCSKGTFNALGRATPDLACIACTETGYASYFGSTHCGPDFEKNLVYNIFLSLGGQNWTHADGWQEHGDICSWYGITCYQSQYRAGEVQKIDLSDNNLSGSMDIPIWQLGFLEELDLSKNDITVSFDGIANAQALETLRLSETKVSSFQGIAAVPQLKQLHLTNCEVDGPLPEELYQMTQLEELYLNYNKISGTLSTAIGQLSQLKHFYVFHNKFNGTIPSEIGLLDNVEVLSLGENKFTGEIPMEMNSLQKLRILSLRREGSEDPVEPFSVVQDVGLTGNIIPFSNTPNLRELYLSENHLVGSIPTDFLSAIEDTRETIIVDLSSNMLDGGIPASLVRFDDLRLDLTENRLHSIPNEFCSKTEWFGGQMALGCDAFLCPPGTSNEYGRRVGTEVCEPCNFHGAAVFYGSRQCGPLMPEVMPERTMLQQIFSGLGGLSWTNSDNWLSEDVSICQWSGVTCENFNGEDKVTELDLSNNGLSGLVPSIVFYLPKIRKLDLGQNDVWVKFDDMGGNSSLEELYLDETSVASLEGIERARNLRVLHMHRVSLDGQSIPEEFYDLTYLSIFALSESGVTGTISSNIGKLTNLQSILLHGNDLTGTIPAEIGLLTQLEDLFLTDNKMFGTLPSEMSLLTSLRDIFLDNRNRRGAGFSGPLPSFYNMPKLRDLHLASNSITGQIPRDLFAGVDDKSAEINCDISSNFLTGAIPSQLSAFGDLNLDVTDNEITSIEDGLCSQASSWFGGSLGSYGCNGLLCPAGTYNAQGRQSSENTPCVVCSGENVPPYLGQTSCLSDERKKEREILKIFFEATNGQKWKNNAGWLQTDNYCQWYGITCVDDGSTVESISLGSNNLVGKIPSEIYDLSDLSDLILYSNPIEFSFDGIYKASNLENLRLDSTGLKSLDGIGEARGLKSIDVRFNNLRGQLPSLDNLESLEVLSLSSNKLIGPLPSFAQNRKLVSLRAGSNMFSGSVPSFSNHPNMRTLDLAANSLSGSIPEDILDEVDSSAEFFLDLSSNELTGGVPRSLSRFQDLTLYLRDNQIEDLHSDLCSQNDWNEGDVGLFQCDGILCPPNTFSPGTGRASRGGSDCQKCDSSKYFGATTCGASSGGSPSVVYSMGLFSVLLSTILLAYL